MPLHLLDELDKELERRGHRFCRYADDCNICVRSYKAGERVLKSIRELLWKQLKLKINEEKSAIALVWEKKFLGYRLDTSGRPWIAPQSLSKLKDTIRKFTKRSRGASLETVIEALNVYLHGWLGYFRLASGRIVFRDLNSWIRRKLRCYRLK